MTITYKPWDSVELSTTTNRTDTIILNGTKRNTINTLFPTINIKQYGAVGDGVTNDTNAIQNAINAAISVNGCVIIPQGNFITSDSINITDTVLICGEGGTITQTGSTKKTFNVTGDNVTIEGIKFVGLGEEDPWGSTSHNGVAGIYVTSAEGVIIRNNKFTNHAGGSIFLDGTSPKCKVINNIIIGMGSPTIEAGDNGSDAGIIYSGTGSLDKDDLIIANNDISNHAFGIIGVRSNGVIINNNTIHDIPGQHGVYISNPKELSITGNVVRNTQQTGIRVGNSTGADIDYAVTISGNTISEVSQQVGATSTAIHVHQGTVGYYMTNISITGNNIYDSGYTGMEIRGTRNALISGNRISTTTYFGLQMFRADGAVIGNSFYRTDVCAMYLYPGASGCSISVDGAVLIDCPTYNTQTTPFYKSSIYTSDAASPDNGRIYFGNIQVRMQEDLKPANYDSVIESAANSQVIITGPILQEVGADPDWVGSVNYEYNKIPSGADDDMPDGSLFYGTDHGNVLCSKNYGGVVSIVSVSSP